MLCALDPRIIFQRNKIKLNKKNKDYFINKFYLPDIPINFSKKMHLFANSSIDISDGFFQDLSHILSNSNFSSDIIVNKIPIDKPVKEELKSLYLINAFSFNRITLLFSSKLIF